MYSFLATTQVRRIAGVLGISLAILSLPGFAHELKAGERLTFVLSENKPGGEEAVQTYFNNAFPLSQAAGMRELTTFKVERVMMGNGKPEGSGLYLWPSKEAAHKVRNNPEYLKKFKPLRPQAWNQLQAVDMDITKPLSIHLDKTKTYTAALLWIKDQAAYDRYFKGMQPVRDQLGVKTILKLPGVRYDKLTEGEIAPPNWVVIFEWATPQGPESYPKAPEFQAQLGNYQQGISKLEWYQLGFWK